MYQFLSIETLKKAIPILEVVDKSIIGKARDPIMMGQTDAFFSLAIQNPELAKAGWDMYYKEMSGFGKDMQRLISQYRAGRISTKYAIKRWREFTKLRYKNLFQAGAMAQGNPYYKELGLTRKDLAFMNGARRWEQQKFQKFLQDIKNPNFKPRFRMSKDDPRPWYLQRAEAYAMSGRAQFMNGMVAGAGSSMWIRWVLGFPKIDHCPDCPPLSRKKYTWKTLPTVPRAGFTQCKFRCYCHLEFEPRRREKVFDLAGKGTLQALTAPGRYARLYDKGGMPLGGSALKEIEDYYSRMFKARQMISVTKGSEKLAWIQERKKWNQMIIDKQRLTGYRSIPGISVRDLVNTIKVADARAVDLGGILGEMNWLGAGDELLFVRGDYLESGTVYQRRGQLYFRSPNGMDIPINAETDIIYLLNSAKYGNPNWFRLEEQIRAGLTAEELAYYDEIMSFSSKSMQEILENRNYSERKLYDYITKVRMMLKESKESLLVHGKKIGPGEMDYVFSAERNALHRKIADSFLDKVKVPKQKEFLMTGGYPGAGKSTSLDDAFPGWRKKYVHVDSDEIKKLLARADGHEKLAWRAPLYHREADFIIDLIMQKAEAQGKSILFDGTMKSQGKVERMAKTYGAKGYQVKALFADLPLTKAAERALGRFMGESGRFVDPSYIVTHDLKNMRTFEAIKKLVDAWYHYSTDVPKGQKPLLISKWEKWLEELE